MIAKLQKNKYIKFPAFCLHIGQMIIYMLAANILIANLMFALGMSVNILLLLLSFTASVLLTYFLSQEKPNSRAFMAEVISVIILLGILTIISGLIYDRSYDGNAYHKQAIGLLKYGWNPLRDVVSQFEVSIYKAETMPNTIWSEAYPKQTWIFAASIYCITGNIESGKVYTMLSMIAVFCITYYYLNLRNKSRLFCVLFSFSAGVTPIACAQLASFYVDGYLHKVLFLLILGLTMWLDEGEVSPRLSASILAAAMIICGNIKFTGLMMGGIYCIIYYLFKLFLWKRYSIDKNMIIKKYLRSGILFALLAVVTTIWAGASTYVTNTIRHGTPLYPLTGKNSQLGFLDNQEPVCFQEYGIIKKLFYSLFSRMDIINRDLHGYSSAPLLKVPFSIHYSELPRLVNTDTNISGFGVWFGGLFIISVVVIAIYLFQCDKKRVEFYYWIVNLIAIAGLMLGIDQSWRARYSPYVYYIVLIGFYFILDFYDKVKIRRKNMVLFVCVFTCLISFNSLSFLLYKPVEVLNSKNISKQFEELEHRENIEIESNWEASGIYYNFLDKDIKPYMVNDISDKDLKEQFYYEKIRIKY